MTQIRNGLTNAARAIMLLLLLVGLVAVARGQDRETLEAARKEGKVTIFGSLQDDVMRDIQSGFEKKYPGVKSVYWRASTTAVMDRAINEFRTGKVSWDVFFHRGRCDGGHAPGGDVSEIPGAGGGEFR